MRSFLAARYLKLLAYVTVGLPCVFLLADCGCHSH